MEKITTNTELEWNACYGEQAVRCAQGALRISPLLGGLNYTQWHHHHLRLEPCADACVT